MRPSSDSPLRELTKLRFGYATTKNVATVTVGTTPTRIVKNDPTRLQLALSNVGLGTIYVSTNRAVAVASGTPLGAGGGFAIYKAQEDGEAVGQEYWAIVNSGTVVLYYEEILAVR